MPKLIGDSQRRSDPTTEAGSALGGECAQANAARQSAIMASVPHDRTEAMTTGRVFRRPRFPVVHGWWWAPVIQGWWTAIAQNVAPRRFHARVERRLQEDQRRMLASTDIPTFALAGDGSADTTTRIFVSTGGIAMKRDGPFGLRRFRVHVAKSLCTSERTADGGDVSITSERQSRTFEVPPNLRERAHMIHHFLVRLDLPADDSRVERRTVDFPPGRAHPVLAVSEDLWSPFEIVLDGKLLAFERVMIDDHWLALGTVDDVAVAIEGHHFDPERLELVRLDRGKPR